MKNFAYLFLSIILLSCSSTAQKCADFKTGEFRYEDKAIPYRIIRTASQQTETNLKTGLEIRSTIEWKSACEYVLTYTAVLNSEQDVESIIGSKIFVKIIETDGNRMVVHTKSEVLDEEIAFLKVN
ncbi:hypothetical protein ACJD0Z_17035 [Flavobacteriaceae bacterium M23B6Z8]